MGTTPHRTVLVRLRAPGRGTSHGTRRIPQRGAPGQGCTGDHCRHVEDKPREVSPDGRRYTAPVPTDAVNDLIERLRPILADQPKIAAAWLFGSAARGELRPDSDVDVGILLRDPRATAVDEYLLLGELTARLETATAPRAVDVVLLEHQGPVFAHEALADGRLILEQDRKRRVDFEATTVMRGIDFRPTWELARRGQLAALRRRIGAQR